MYRRKKVLFLWMFIIIGCINYISIYKTTDIISAFYVNAVEDNEIRDFKVTFNNNELILEQYSILNENKIYVPLRPIFETMGTVIFYNGNINTIIGLTRDGDFIKHEIATTKVEINGKNMELELPSFVENAQTMIPSCFITDLLSADIIYDESVRELKIIKPMYNNDYHKLVNEVLQYSSEMYFNPELFNKYLLYKANRYDMSVEQIIIHVNMGLNNPFYSSIKTIDNPNDQLVLCNKYNKLSDDFTTDNLVSVPKGYYVNDGKDYKLNETVMAFFKSMADDAKKQGIYLKIISGYRTYNYQANLYKSSVARNGKTHADKYVARPRHSEHETGLALDINSVLEWFDATKEFQWLQNNAHLYGFILRYHKDKEHITGFGYEPWHYRFVGVEIAKDIREKGITFDEYCAKYLKQTDYTTN